MVDNMTNFGIKDWYTEVEKGNVSGHSMVHKFGKNPAVGTGALEDIWYNGGLYAWPIVASTLEAISTSINDTAGGTGAQTITIQGVDINGLEISDTLSMNGTAATLATANSYFRVNRAFVATSGTYATGLSGSHAGTITIRISGAGATQALIAIENGLSFGQTQIARYTMPCNAVANDRQLYLVSAHVQVESTGSRTGSAYFQTRSNPLDVSTPFDSRRVRITPAKQEGVFEYVPRSPILLGTCPIDTWWSGIMDSGGGAGDISVDYELLIVDV